MTGHVFNIQRFSLHDGPGVRTTAFLMGCNLRCRWCHNPEGMQFAFRLQYDAKQCIGCGACAAVCPAGVHSVTDREHPLHFDACTLCGACIKACPAGALELTGREYTAEALAEQLCRDLLFYKEQGGVTFSGGEPLLQADFVAATAKLCRERGVPTVAVDTAGMVPRAAFEAVLPYTDYFLYDVKAVSNKVHRQGTGESNHMILENLRWLDGQGKAIYIRVPVIPSVNDAPEEIAAIGELVHSLRSVQEFRLLPYHTFGREKYATLGESLPECFAIPDDKTIEQLQHIAGCF